MRRLPWLAALAALALPATAQAGELSWNACRTPGTGARCGHVVVPLDRLDPAAGSRRIGFELYDRERGDLPSLGTLLDIEGGPGYPSTGSRSSYLALDGPLRDRREVLLVDPRGTGTSGALICPALRLFITDYRLRAGQCAGQLGPVVDRYGTAEIVDDLADVLDALGVAQADVYGDSYGSYAAQAFAVRHPSRVRSLVLDATYPLPGTDPAYHDLAEAMQRGFRLACERRPSCAARGQDPVGVLTAFVYEIRASPRSGVGTGAEGDRRRVRVDVPRLVALVQSTYYDLAVYRDLLAAVRAWHAGDRAPLLRLLVESRWGRRAGSPHAFSEAQYLAVTCHDYPQLWDVAASVPERQAQLAANLAARPAEPFLPFTATEWTAPPYEGATACLRWPGPLRDEPPVDPAAPYPAVPTLVLNGDLDTITASSGARVVAARFPASTFVEVHNMNHVSALGDVNACAEPMVRRFIVDLDPGDTACAARLPEVRVVDAFPVRAADAEAADPAAGDASGVLDRKVAAVAAATVADALQRWWINYSGRDRALRGGTWTWAEQAGRVTRFRFDGARFAADVAVSGKATWDREHGTVQATLGVAGPGGLRQRLAIAWDAQAPLAVATIEGRSGGTPLHATLLAP